MPLHQATVTPQIDTITIESETPPINPNFNQYWVEITGGGLFVREWFWNGTYWLSKQTFTATSNFLSVTGGGVTGITVVENQNQNLFLINHTFRCKVVTTNNTTNYWTGGLRRTAYNNIETNLVEATFSTMNSLPDSRIEVFSSINMHLDVATLFINYFRYGISKIGAPGTLTIAPALNYRLARK